MAIKLRSLTEEERAALERLAHSRTAPTRQVERAQIIWRAAQGLTIPRIAAQLRLHSQTARDWVKRFNQNGLPGLDDLPRPGKPPTYTAKERAEVIALTLTDPQTLHLPFACWTLDRLVAYLHEEKRIAMQPSRVSELLIAEAYAGGARKRGLANGLIPISPKKRAHPNALHHPARRQRRNLP